MEAANLKESNEKNQGKEKVTEVTTFPVQFTSTKINNNISLSTNIFSKQSQEKIIKQAIDYHLKNNILEATKYYQYCINQGFNDPRIFCNYGGILKDLGKLKEAEELLRKAIKIDPYFARAHYNLGVILRDLNNIPESIISYREAIKNRPNYADAYLNLGNILLDIGSLEEAEKSIKKAIEIKPNFVEAHLTLGNIFNEIGKLKEAEVSTVKAIELNPSNAEAHFNLGSIFKGLNKLDESILCYKKAIDLKKDFKKAVAEMGITMTLKGNYIEGLQKIKEGYGSIVFDHINHDMRIEI